MNNFNAPVQQFEVSDEWMGNPNAGRYEKIFKELRDVLKFKGHDYGESFHQTWLEEGYATARVRLSDKLNRFKTLSKKEAENESRQKVMDESIRDTLMDLAGYAIMGIAEIDREREEVKNGD